MPTRDLFTLYYDELRRYAGGAFRRLPDHAQDDAIDDAIALAWERYTRATADGSQFGRGFLFVCLGSAINDVRVGRRLTGEDGGTTKRPSKHALKWHSSADGALPPRPYASDRDIPGQVALKIDLAAWLRGLPPRRARLAQALCDGVSVPEACRRSRCSEEFAYRVRRMVREWLADRS